MSRTESAPTVVASAAAPSGPSDRPRQPATKPSRPRVQWRDLADESIAGLFARPARALLTVLGTVLGIAALVGTLGISRTQSNQIVGRFDALAATEVTAKTRDTGVPGQASLIPWNAEARVKRLNGVRAAGTISAVNASGALTRTVPVNDPTNATEFDLPLRAVSPGLFPAVRTRLRSGRVFDAGHSMRADRVAVLGPGAADRLGITRLDNMPGIYVGDRVFQVIGIIDDVARRAELLDAIVIPEGTARALYRLKVPERLQVDTAVGAAALVASQIAPVLNPNDPGRIEVASPPEPKATKAAVTGDLNRLFLVLGGISLLIGAIGIANVTLVSVIERTGEIGLRRSLGAARRHIAVQFLSEAALTGLAGGILGSSVGTLATVLYGASIKTTPVLDARIPLLAPLLGLFTGVLAGLYPAVKAANKQPVEALRSGT